MSGERSQASAKAGGKDTEPDNALDVVRSSCESIASYQGGTEVTSVSDHGKGNSGAFDLKENERVNSDPQGFSYHDQPRRDSADYEDPYYGY